MEWKILVLSVAAERILCCLLRFQCTSQNNFFVTLESNFYTGLLRLLGHVYNWQTPSSCCVCNFVCILFVILSVIPPAVSVILSVIFFCNFAFVSNAHCWYHCYNLTSWYFEVNFGHVYHVHSCALWRPVLKNLSDHKYLCLAVPKVDAEDVLCGLYGGGDELMEVARGCLRSGEGEGGCPLPQ